MSGQNEERPAAADPFEDPDNDTRFTISESIPHFVPNILGQ